MAYNRDKADLWYRVGALFILIRSFGADFAIYSPANRPDHTKPGSWTQPAPRANSPCSISRLRVKPRATFLVLVIGSEPIL